MNWVVQHTVMKAGVFAQRIGIVGEEDEPDEVYGMNMNYWGCQGRKK